MFLLFPQQRTSRPRFVSPVPSLVAFDHRGGFSLLKKLELLRVNESHRSPCSKRQRFAHPPPDDLAGEVAAYKKINLRILRKKNEVPTCRSEDVRPKF